MGCMRSPVQVGSPRLLNFYNFFGMMKRPAIYLYFFSIIAVVTIISGALFLIGNNFSKDKDNLILSDQSNELFDSEPASGNLPEPEMATTTMVFGGDVMLSRKYSGSCAEPDIKWRNITTGSGRLKILRH